MLKVIHTPIWVNQFAEVTGVKMNSHSVDSEVTAKKVAINRAGLHAW